MDDPQARLFKKILEQSGTEVQARIQHVYPTIKSSTHLRKCSEGECWLTKSERCPRFKESELQASSGLGPHALFRPKEMWGIGEVPPLASKHQLTPPVAQICGHLPSKWERCKDDALLYFPGRNVHWTKNDKRWNPLNYKKHVFFQ